jgi:hypothetical protein
MSSKTKNKGTVVNMSLLASIANGTVTRVTQEEGVPLLNHTPPLITVNTSDVVDGKAAVALTDTGRALAPTGAAGSEAASASVPQYAIIPGLAFVPGEKKQRGRFGGAGAPTIYPWASMDVGGTFFVPVSAKHPDPVKSLTSAVSSANMKYSEEYGEAKPVTRTKRGPGNKAVVGFDGKPERERVMRRDRKPVKKFELRAVKNGETIGAWSAPSDGVLVGRVL